MWQHLIDKQDKNIIREHLSFMIKNKEDEKILDLIIAQFLKAEIDSNKLLLTFRSEAYDEEVVLECNAPFETEKGPKSWIEVSKVHNGISWESLGGGYLGFNGIQEGGSAIEQSWEYYFLEEAEEENEEFITSLKDNGYGIEDTEGIIDYGQNWVIAHPGKINQLGEPTLYFVSHGDCEAVLIEEAQNLEMGQVLLRVIAEYILDEDYFEETYN
ncbi:hypothetical protein [Aquimarina litoralis]|uniref:hypothetical protein n=1 Tax=Aquimarina litoralis TaxID=584605 RepID=UPI001C5802E5|nr:hypothetical protein [Aquimarina litoralis]MBW1295030.1 molybdate metabolism regulator [Aquimarina litoralis]